MQRLRTNGYITNPVSCSVQVLWVRIPDLMTIVIYNAQQHTARTKNMYQHKYLVQSNTPPTNCKKKKKITFRDKYHPNILIMQTFRLPRNFSVLKNKISTIGSRLFRASITLYYFLSHKQQYCRQFRGIHCFFL